jgi:uncharacterized membrane protein YgcG
MSQKYIKAKNNNEKNTAAYGKYFAQAVYDNHFVETEQLADFIQKYVQAISLLKDVIFEETHDNAMNVETSSSSGGSSSPSQEGGGDNTGGGPSAEG